MSIVKTVTLYNLSVKLETDDAKLLSFIEKFLLKYYTSKSSGFNSQVVITKVYASITKNPTSVLFHINQFKHFIHYYTNSFSTDTHSTLHIDNKIDLRDYPDVHCNFKVRDSWVLREDQKEVYDFLLDNPTSSKLVPLQTGSGKSQPLYCKIKTPTGWVTMGSISVGDEVMTKCGDIALVTGVYPQGETLTYRLTFDDYRETEASSEHLWNVYITNNNKTEYKTVTTAKLEYLLLNTNNKIEIDLIEPETVLGIELPYRAIDIGKSIANLNSSEFKVNGMDYGSFTTSVISGHILKEEYLNCSYEDRVHIILGILEYTDITGLGNDKVIYRTKCRDLCYQLQYLVRSVGGKCTVDFAVTDTIIYRAHIYHLGKLSTVNPSRLELVDVENIGMVTTQCISIDHPSKLYITDDFIVTHNTVIALTTIGTLQKRLGIVILARFIEKWVSDIATIHEADTSDVMVIKGSKHLRSVIMQAKNSELTHNYYVFSAETIQSYITSYEENATETVEYFGCAPIELFPLLGISIMLNDETHMSFHLVYKILINTNVKYQIGLSATLVSDDSIVKRMHRVVYPDNCIYKNGSINKYIDVYPISYNIDSNLRKYIRTTNYGSSMYSHTAYEQSVTRQNFLRSKYCLLILANIEDYYEQHYIKNDRLLVFVSTVKFATDLVQFLKEKLPNRLVKRYCEDDDYDNLMTGEVIVSTLLSASTGVDIKDLRVVINTVSISSTPSNLQSLGRLRKLKDRDVKFCYLYSDTIGKHKEYHLKRVEIFKPMVNNITYRRSRKGL